MRSPASRATASLLAVALAAAPAWAQEGLGIPPKPDAQEDKKIEASKLTKAPKQITFVKAQHPKEALEKGIAAEVVLTLEIGADGKVANAAVAAPVNPPGMGFEEAVLAVAKQWEFSPAEIDNKPAAVQITYKYKFLVPTPEAPAETPPVAGEAPPAAPAPARQPVVNFSGVLRERGTRDPIIGALVTVFRDDDGKPVGYEATTDDAGRFQFLDLPAGEWRVNAEPPGYYPLKTAEEIRVNEKTEATYWIERGSYNPYDVTVTAIRPRKEVSRTVITAAEISKVPGAAGDPLAVIQNFAGVARTPIFSGQIIVRGSAPEDTQVFVDGVSVPLVYHFGGLRSVVPVDMIDALEFYPGNFSVQYGRGIGGIIDIDVKRLQPKRAGGAVDVSFLDGSLYLQAPFGNKGGIAFGVRRSWIDTLLKAAVPSDANVNFTTAPRYYDTQLLANYRPSSAHDFRGFFFASDDRIKILFDNPAALDPGLSGNSFSSSTSFYRSLFTYKYVPNDRFENTLRISQGRNWYKANFGQLKFDLDTYLAQIRNTTRQKIGDQVTLVYGVDFQYLGFQGLVQLPLPQAEGQPQTSFDVTKVLRSEIDHKNYWYPAGFVELEWKPFERLLVLPGVRVDYFADTEQTIGQPRLTTRWQVANRWTAKGGIGYFAQEPTFNTGESDTVFGNPNLKAERAMHYSAGMEYKPRPWISVDLTGFYKTIYDLIGPTDKVVNGVPLRYDNGGRGRVYGLELVAQHQFTNNFSGWLAYTLSRSERRDPDATEYRLFDYDQTNILTAIAAYVLPRNWQVGGRYRLVTGNPRTPIIGAASVFNSDTDQYDPAYGRVNSARLGTFHQLDVRIDKRWIYQSWMLNLYLDIQNIYNRQNPEGISCNYNFRECKPQAGLPILPILGLRADF